jgi:hypothetical protein
MNNALSLRKYAPKSLMCKRAGVIQPTPSASENKQYFYIEGERRMI